MADECATRDGTTRDLMNEMTIVRHSLVESFYQEWARDAIKALMVLSMTHSRLLSGL